MSDNVHGVLLHTHILELLAQFFNLIEQICFSVRIFAQIEPELMGNNNGNVRRDRKYVTKCPNFKVIKG